MATSYTFSQNIIKIKNLIVLTFENFLMLATLFLYMLACRLEKQKALGLLKCQILQKKKKAYTFFFFLHNFPWSNFFSKSKKTLLVSKVPTGEDPQQ